MTIGTPETIYLLHACMHATVLEALTEIVTEEVGVDSIRLKNSYGEDLAPIFGKTFLPRFSLLTSSLSRSL